MYALSRIAFKKKVPLNREFFKEFVSPQIVLYDNVLTFLRKIKLLEETARYKKVGLKIYFFIVTAGLEDLVKLSFPEGLIERTFGCRYEIIAYEGTVEEPESVPVFCMDETMKTRSMFEISKGSFLFENKAVNDRVPNDSLWAPFENIVYIGDGYSDVPAFSLVRSKGGMGIAVHDPELSKGDIDKKHGKLRTDKRADLVTEAIFETSGDLFKFLSSRCEQICHRYHAAKFD